MILLENQQDQRVKGGQQDSMTDAKQEFKLQSKQFGALLIVDHFHVKLLDISVEVYQNI
jgi:hypothetical protein